MRTKSLFAAAAIIAAGAASSFAQGNVYSLNIVGYVNVDVTAGQLALVSNPLKPSDGNNDINNVLKLADGTSDGSQAFLWNAGTASWVATEWIDGLGWIDSLDVGVGSALFIVPSTTQTITFVGEVATGESATTLGAGLSLVGSKIPVAGPVPGSTVGNDGDSIFTWNGTSWEAFEFIEGFGWTADSEEGPSVGVAQGFFYNNTGSPLTWTTTLNP